MRSVVCMLAGLAFTGSARRAQTVRGTYADARERKTHTAVRYAKGESPIAEFGEDSSKLLRTLLIALNPAAASQRNPVPQVTEKVDNPASIPSRLLKSQIKNSETMPIVIDLLAKHNDVVKGAHLAEAWQKFANFSSSVGPSEFFTEAKTLIAITIGEIEKLGPRALAIVAHRAVRSKYYSPLLFDAVAERALECIGDFNPQNLANTIWAFAKAQHDEPELFQAVAEEAVESLSNFTAQGLSSIVWAFATMDYEAPELFDAVAEATTERISDFNEQGLSNIVWAFAGNEHAAPKLFDAVAEAVVAKEESLDEFTGQGLSNIVWAFAKSNHAAPKLFDIVAQTEIEEESARVMSNTVWAFAKLDHAAPDLFDAVAESVVQRMEELSPQNIANTVWAYAKMNHSAPKLFDAVVDVEIENCYPQVIATVLQAFATLNHEAPDLFDAVAGLEGERLQYFTGREFAATLEAFAAFHHRTEAALELFDFVGEIPADNLAEFKPREIVSTISALADLNHPAPKLFDAVVELMAERRGEFKKHHRSSIASAFAKLNYTAPNLLNENDSGLGEASTLELTDDASTLELTDDGPDEKPEPPASDNLYIEHLPMGVTEDMLRDTFETAGDIKQLRIMRRDDSIECAALIRFSSPEEATAARTTLDGTVVNGSTPPLFAKTMTGDDESQEDHVYIENVPTSTLEEELDELLSKYGEVKWCSVLGYTPGKSRVESLCAAFVEMSSFIEASKAVDALNGTVVHFSELIRPMKVRYAALKEVN